MQTDPKIGKSIFEINEEKVRAEQDECQRKVELHITCAKYDPNIPLEKQLIYEKTHQPKRETYDVVALNYKSVTKSRYVTRSDYRHLSVNEYLVLVQECTYIDNERPVIYYEATMWKIGEVSECVHHKKYQCYHIDALKYYLDKYHSKEYPLPPAQCCTIL